MNELNKLLGSLLLLGGGFLAASLIGPPELAGRLSQLIHPTPAVDANGLRPLPAATAAVTSDGWPSMPPAPASSTGQSTTPPAFAPLPQAGSSAGFQPPSQEPITRSVASPWPSEPAATSKPSDPLADEPAPSDEWLTGATFDHGPAFVSDPPTTTPPAATRRPGPATTAPARPLEPVARRGVSPSPSTRITSAARPELRPPLPPRLEETDYQQSSRPDLASPTGPSLQASPYGDRPGFDAFADGPKTDTAARSNPLRFDRRGFDAEPVERTPIATRYTRHVVTDGDTLASLAGRYLGDAGRAQELFELNRDRLDHPDVLPIGMVLKAPDDRGRRQATSPAGTATPIDAFPPLPGSGTFSTVAATDNVVRDFARDVVQGLQRPMTEVGAAQEPALSESDRLGPVDPFYNQEVSWDANRW